SRPPAGPRTMIRAVARDSRKYRMRRSIADLGGVAGRPQCRAHDLDMSAAAAEIISQRLCDLRLRRMWVDVEQRSRRHDHAVEAIAALSGLLDDESRLHWIGMLARAEPFQRRDLAS